jgi:hypothetical protein
MPISYAIDPDQNLVSIALGEDFRSADTLGFVRDLLEDPNLRPGMNGIVDTEGARARSLVGADVRALADLAHSVERLWDGSRWAFVAPSPVLYGLSRMYQMLRGDAGCEIGVFRELTAARTWIGAAASTERR